MTSSDFGRVGEDGTVFVRTDDGERAVGSGINVLRPDRDRTTGFFISRLIRPPAD